MKRTHKEKITSVLALCAGAGLFIWFCIPLFWGVFHVGNGGGILFSLFLIAGGIWYVPLRSRMEQAKHAKPLRVLRRSCWGILAVCFAWAAFDRLHAVAHAFALRQRDGCYFRLQGGQRGVAGAH